MTEATAGLMPARICCSQLVPAGIMQQYGTHVPMRSSTQTADMPRCFYSTAAAVAPAVAAVALTAAAPAAAGGPFLPP